MSWATWPLFTGVPARCVVLLVWSLGPLGSCSPVCALCPLLCLCGVLNHLAPVHWCAGSVCCVACAVSWATWLMFTGVPARCVALFVLCPGQLGACLAVCPLGVLCLVLRSAFLKPWCLSPSRGLAPLALLRGCAGHAEAGRERGFIVPALAPVEAGALGSLRVVPVRGPMMGLSLAGHSGVGLGLRALRWLACADQVTDASSAVRHSTADSAGAPGLFRLDADTSPCGPEDATPSSRACVRVPVLPSQVGRAGLLGAFWCASPFPLAALSFCFARPPQDWGCPFPVPLFAFFFVSLFPLCASVVSCLPCFPALGALGLGALFFFPPSPPSCVLFFSSSPPLCALVVTGFLWFLARGALGLGGVCCLLGLSAASRLRVRSRCFCVSCLAVCCSLVVAAPPPPPPPLLCLAVFVAAARCPPPFFCLLCSCLLGWRSSAVLTVCPPAPLSLVCFAGLPLLGSPCALAAFVFPVRPLAASWWLLPPPPPLLCLTIFDAAGRCSVFFSFYFFFLLLCSCLLAWRSSAVLAVCCPPPPPSAVCFVGLPLLGSPCALAAFVFPAWPLAAPWYLLPPLILLCLAVFVAAARCSVFFFPPLLRCSRLLAWRSSTVLAVCCPPPIPARCVRGALCYLVLPRCAALRSGVLRCRVTVFRLFAVCFAVRFWSALPCAVPCCVSLSAVLRRAAARCAAPCCAVVCCVVSLRSLGTLACCAVPSGAARRPGALCLAALCCAVFPRAVCFVLCVFCRGVLVRAVVRRCALCCVCPGCRAVRSLSSLLCGMLCFVLLVRLRCAVHVVRALTGALCYGAPLCVVLFPLVFRGAVLGLVARGCLLVACFGVGVAVGLRGLLLCGWCGFLWCPASLCRVLWCCAVAWCCAVVLLFCGAVCVCFALLWPVVRRRAVLCCVVGCLWRFLPGGGVCVLWCLFPPCRCLLCFAACVFSYLKNNCKFC